MFNAKNENLKSSKILFCKVICYQNKCTEDNITF